MKKITSFCVDHDVLEKGMYISRIDGDVITYDLRMVKPNKGGYLENAGLHTFEHLFATYVRNSAYSDDIIYVGPMGCRTGFYLLTRDHLSHEQALSLVQETMDFIAAYEGGNTGSTGKPRMRELSGPRSGTGKTVCRGLRKCAERVDNGQAALRGLSKSRITIFLLFYDMSFFLKDIVDEALPDHFVSINTMLDAAFFKQQLHV